MSWGGIPWVRVSTWSWGATRAITPRSAPAYPSDVPKSVSRVRIAAMAGSHCHPCPPCRPGAATRKSASFSGR